MNGQAPLDDCALVDRWLDDWLAGRLPAAQADRLEAHRQTCERCARLVAIMRDSDAADAPGDEIDLLAGVMNRTAGPACASAVEQLPALADGEMDAASREILQSHLAHCDACSALLATLQESRAVLPTLAEIEPPLGFTARVLARTSGAPRRAVAEWWRRLLARPRASLELAYVGTLILVLLVGNPVAAFRGASDTANRVAGAGVERLAQVKPPAAAVDLGAQLVGAFSSLTKDVTTELARRWEQARAIATVVETSVQSAFGWARSIDVKRVLRGAGLSISEQKPLPASSPSAPAKK
jgi:anti-sigma factor RsiW